LIVPLEGALKHIPCWKSGFYHIACGVKVPIALGFIDFKRKEAGIGGLFELSGYFEADLFNVSIVHVKAVLQIKGLRSFTWRPFIC